MREIPDSHLIRDPTEDGVLSLSKLFPSCFIWFMLGHDQLPAMGRVIHTVRYI